MIIETNVLIADVLKNFTGEFPALVALCVDKMAEISSGAACGAVEVFARNSSVVSRLNQLVGIWRWV